MKPEEDIRELTSEEIAAVAGGKPTGSIGFLILDFISDHLLPPGNFLDKIVDHFEGKTMLPSDIHLKHDIVPLGRLANGLGFYRFSYNGSDKAYVGVMAQEVQSVMPEAVVRGRDGYLRVRYDRLGLKLQTWDEWVASGKIIPASAASTQH
jgi:hypothetical protein